MTGKRSAALLDELVAIAGAEAVRTDDEALALAQNDVHMTGERPLAMVRPSDSQTVSRIVAAVTAAGHAVLPRGGGLSYTGGYTPPTSRSVTLDMGGMNRILEVAEDDMYIHVQAGVTWKQIQQALAPRGLRLPFFGTFSGAGATVGGGLSHGALFFGSARYGSAAENVIGLEVILADGTQLRTGQGALAVGSKPFLRSFGPDLTGIFTHDGGAFGIKTEASFRLIRAPSEQGYGSFAFTDIRDASAALCAIARADIAEEVYILDPAGTDAIAADGRRLASTAWKVAREAGSPVRAAAALLSLARGGTGVIPKGHFSLHFVAAGRSADAVRADVAEGRRIAKAAGGLEVEPSIPRVARAELFQNLSGVFGAGGGRWAALNAKVAHSDAPVLLDAFDAMIAPYAAEMAAKRVRFTRLASALANHSYSFEPVYHWHDSWQPIHRHVAEPGFVQSLTEPAPDPEARALVDELRGQTTALFRRLGAASNQIARTYPFLDALSPAPRHLLQSFKALVDPDGLINPGVLGLGTSEFGPTGI